MDDDNKKQHASYYANIIPYSFRDIECVECNMLRASWALYPDGYHYYKQVCPKHAIFIPYNNYNNNNNNTSQTIILNSSQPVKEIWFNNK